MTLLSQYYTQQIYSKLLINTIDVEYPAMILDMGVGDGSLTKAALERWNAAQYFAVDIDSKNCEIIKSVSDSIVIVNEDGLDPSINKKLKIKVGTIDVAICNPPYGTILNEETFNILYKRAKLNSCITLKRVPLDVVFLANNLSMLKEGGQLGIILPDGVLTRKDLRGLRRELMNNHTIKSIIQLPDNIFKGTEARTHILILSKGQSNYKKVNVMFANENGEIKNVLHVDKNDLIDRMDYSFHLWKSEQTLSIGKSLLDLGVHISRGSYTHKDIKRLGVNYIHTTNIFDEQINSILLPEEYKAKIYALKGDILMARVGKRCIGKIAYIEKGEYLITDCIYRLRVPPKYRKVIWNYLNSKEVNTWMNVSAHGVCSKVISKEDLLNLRIPYVQ